MGPEVAPVTVIVKMIRVMLLVPVLLILGFWIASKAKKKSSGKETTETKGKVAIPWFAFGFLLVIGFNSLNLLPAGIVNFINDFDTFLLTMAMAALGAETSADKFKQAGAKPFILAGILFIWLIAGGYAMARYLAPIWL